MVNFRYKDLPSEDHIRIMELLPGSKDDPLRCHLTSEPRQHTIHSYEAISYAWGSSKDLFSVVCCGENLSVTKNLANALLELRSQNPKTSRRLWIDAICINQRDSGEKNKQVKQLGWIFRNARQVIAWLGNDEDGIANDCFRILKNCNVYLGEQFDIYKNTRNIPTLQPPRHLILDAASSTKIRRLMSLSYFQRLWVLQEAAVAKDCQLLWGSHRMSLAELMELACFCDGRTDITRLIGDNEPTFRFWRIIFLCVYRTYDNTDSWRVNKPLIRFLDEKHRDQRGLFLDILQIGSSLFATDARDYIYAFLGNPLAHSPDGKLLLEPDYRKSVKEVYYDVALAFLNSRHESPFLLSFVQHSSADEVTGSDGPSWVPRWRKPQKNPTPGFTIGNIGLSFKAGGDMHDFQFQVYNGSGTAKLLSLQGLIFDHLTWVSRPLRSDNFALHPAQWDEGLRTSPKTYIEMLWDDVPNDLKERYDLTKAPANSPFDENFTYTLVTGYNNREAVSFKRHRKIVQAYLNALKHAGCPEDRRKSPCQTDNQACDASRYERETRNCTNRRLALTKLGRFALVPQFAKPGDACCVFLGMVTPFILRQAATRQYHHLMGEAYVQGIMQGELVAELDRGDIEKGLITLI
ncbi:hypothetical protein H2200_002620 [Cladophialophora chaetospira]|uniref:Heterokaryon incompatibility domain-containing protein n=1 Tax=Cladophialophora chaetospira TaxID=386627 RepID=A0AA39CNR2_9EURO|nr:hypothetical protein H2200_002620 [Cladophialophora chaetospira]